MLEWSGGTTLEKQNAIEHWSIGAGLPWATRQLSALWRLSFHGSNDQPVLLEAEVRICT